MEYRPLANLEAARPSRPRFSGCGYGSPGKGTAV